MRGTSGTPRHTKRSRYRCSLPGLAGFAGLRRTEPEVPRIGSRSTRKRLQSQSSTATSLKKENRASSHILILRIHAIASLKLMFRRSDLQVAQKEACEMSLQALKLQRLKSANTQTQTS